MDYTTGDSWNGTHDRSIEITYQDDDHILVENTHSDHGVGNSFAFQDISRQLNGLKGASYFNDFCYQASLKIPHFRAVRDAYGSINGLEIPATPAIIDAEIAGGVQNTVTTFPRLQIKPKM